MRRTKPKELRVPSNEYATIAAALADSINGDVVIVCEGTYHESVHLAAVDIDLIGQGERKKIVIHSVSRPALTFKALRGSVRNITFVQSGGGCDCAVDISAVTVALSRAHE